MQTTYAFKNGSYYNLQIMVSMLVYHSEHNPFPTFT